MTKRAMKNGLTRWFALWRPRYRGLLVQLGLAGLVAAGLEFAQNRLLQLITQVLGQPLAADHEAPAEGPALLPSVFQEGGAVGTGWRTAFVCLGLFVLVKIVGATVGYWKTRASGRLKVQSEDDMEAEILDHLLRKDDAFFSRHSPAETVSRLAVDVFRVSDRRPLIMSIWWSVLLILGNFVFFVMRDWRMALLALAGCLAGAVWTQRMTRHVTQIDSDYLRQNDSVKSRFEDFLKAASEVQVGGLYSWARHRLSQAQEPRTQTYMRYVRLSAVLSAGSLIAYLLTFVSMIVVIRLRASGKGNESWALVPVVIWAMPTLFESASQIIMQNLQLQLAGTSIKRLLEYEAREMEPAEPAEPRDAARAEAGATSPVAPGRGDAHAFETQNATYRYSSPEGLAQGGIVDVTTEFLPGRWTAIVGGAGSGKSTLLRLLLGRVKPQAGTVLYGRQAVADLTSSSLPDAVSFMPQSPVLLDATILDNILFGRSGNRDVPAALEAEELDLVERIGLGRVCRLKAIDMTPPTGEGLSALDGGVAGLRRRARQWLKDRCQADVLPFESGYSDRRHWILECLLGGRCDRTATIGLLQEHEGRRISSLVPPELAARIARAGQTFLRQSGQLLGIANYHVYAQLAPCPVSEPLWKLLSANAHLCGWQALTPRETATLCIIGLTCCPNDLAGDERADDWRLPEARHAGEQDVRRLREALASVCVPFELDKVHPHLTWRENLLFGVLDARNARTRQAVDNGLLEFIEQDSLREPMTQAGLQSEVGRSGRNLSGGQGQLVALCRAILRRTAVLVLDEPTASLDPASRTRVAEFLRQYVGPRIVISVSHDPEFVRRADEVKVMDGGRLVASGTFDQLKEGSDVFRRILGQT